METHSNTILPMNDEPDNYMFKNKGSIKILDTGKKFPLNEGDQTIGRKDVDNEIEADIAIETEDQLMSRIHIHIVVEKEGKFYRLSLWIPLESKNQTLLDGCWPIQKKGRGNKIILEKNQVIGMPNLKIRVIDE